MPEWRQWLAAQAKSLTPSIFKKHHHFNFISMHYIWVITLSLTGSVIIYASSRGNGLRYIDALFFASGASTQAGLNTVDFNTLNTAQQIVCFLIPMMANPITINSFVVFLRLYWFERRFQNIVTEARLRRGTISKSKAKARGELDDAERGVGGRSITVMHNDQRSRMANDGMLLDTRVGNAFGPASGDAAGAVETPSSPTDARRSGITFAQTVKKSDGHGEDVAKLPPMRSEEEHLAILERQRCDGEVLRIPGPRDAERGIRPERVERGDEEVNNALEASRTHVSEARHQAITIEEPDRRRMQAAKDSDSDELPERNPTFWQIIYGELEIIFKVLSFLRFRKPRVMNEEDKTVHHDDDAVHVHRKRGTLHALKTALSRDKDEGTPYLSFEPTLGRNSAFPDLTEEEREELGGIEYRSLKTLALVLTWYYWGFFLFGISCLLPWIIKTERWGAVVDAASQSRVWWGFFTPSSAFMDLGFTLTPDSMNSFNTAVFPLLLMSFLIVIGNTGFPVMLRFIIWVMSLVVPRGTGIYEELRFLLDHPRRCFTLLFPSAATWWLLFILVIMNGLDVMFFVVLDLGSGPVTELSSGIKFLNGLFEAASTRTAGFSCINLAELHPAVQVSYMIMMYISVFPIAISVRRTNVYEEQSLGIYGGDEAEDHGAGSGNDLSYVGAHLRRQLSFDLWFIFVGLFILAITEGPRLMADDFTMFAVLFEIISAYGTVGMSLGYPTVNASLSSQFSVIGKLIIIAMMIRGRHRGLPYGLDRAILLPSEALNETEVAGAEARMARQVSHASAATNGLRPGSVARRRRSFSGERGAGKIFTAFLHPGPVREEALLRRSTDPAAEDSEPYCVAGVTSRRRSSVAVPPPQRPRGAATTPM
ncbi:cation transport protein-domain-containing protein [Lasiosphaeris hirsuta]|uniref:Potassium transport protein n=1 Tax=Lasiosphaeris hirsuta TaxID=260670 RepID=A0AA40A9L6_9PEZI|nr:cation transport protein-domain-containing protein [Lasiosphaeris hirsuta]